MTPMELLTITGLAGCLANDTEVVPDENGCALWPRGKTSSGYGTVYLQPRKPKYVHIVVYERIVAPIPAGYHVDHVWERGCRSRACFWHEHLEAVTPAENARRAGLARRQQGPRLCGHDWDDDRVGRNDCKVCHREEEARRRMLMGPSQGVVRAQLVRRLSADDTGNEDIAMQVGCSLHTVRRILAGKVYEDK